MSLIEQEIIRPYDNPQYLLSDYDAKFDSLAINFLAKLYGMQWWYFWTFKPQENGIIERKVGS